MPQTAVGTLQTLANFESTEDANTRANEMQPLALEQAALSNEKQRIDIKTAQATLSQMEATAPYDQMIKKMQGIKADITAEWISKNPEQFTGALMAETMATIDGQKYDHIIKRFDMAHRGINATVSAYEQYGAIGANEAYSVFKKQYTDAFGTDFAQDTGIDDSTGITADLIPSLSGMASIAKSGVEYSQKASLAQLKEVYQLQREAQVEGIRQQGRMDLQDVKATDAQELEATKHENDLVEIEKKAEVSGLSVSFSNSVKSHIKEQFNWTENFGIKNKRVVPAFRMTTQIASNIIGTPDESSLFKDAPGQLAQAAYNDTIELLEIAYDVQTNNGANLSQEHKKVLNKVGGQAFLEELAAANEIRKEYLLKAAETLTGLGLLQ